MTEEEYFRKNYPDSCYGDKPLSPHWDFFQDGAEFGERQSEKKIEELEGFIKTQDRKLRQLSKECDKAINRVEILAKENAELKEQNIKDCENFNKTMKEIKEQWNKEHYQLTKAKEIIKEMLSILPKENIEGIYEITEEAEQFLKDNEVEK